MSNFDDLSMAVASFGGNNAVKFDDLGMPSIMVAIPKMKYSDIITGGTQETLPWWIVDGVEKEVLLHPGKGRGKRGQAHGHPGRRSGRSPSFFLSIHIHRQDSLQQKTVTLLRSSDIYEYFPRKLFFAHSDRFLMNSLQSLAYS